MVILKLIMIKTKIIDFFKFLIFKLNRTKFGIHVFQRIINSSMERVKKVSYNGVEMNFSVPNWINEYRIDTFSFKEPETLDWIDQFKDNSILWDIGANVGLYSVYAAKSKKCKVYSFEPSVFNLELLARNIYSNKLQNNITIVPLALSDKISENLFQMTSTQWGGALSTFGEGIDQDGNKMKDVFQYKTLGLSMNDAKEFLKIPAPNYIKVDVDGIEHLILSGSKEILSNVESVLIEINDSFLEQSKKTNKILKDSGLTLIKKYRIKDSNQFNQHWKRI